MICNLCGGGQWEDMGKRKSVKCATCGSLERTRAIKLVFDKLRLPESGARILHFAPEKALSSWFRRTSPSGYDPVDINPAAYPDAQPRRFDLLTDCATLPSDHYDLIVHIHVLEHIPMNIAPILHHLHRALSPNGLHVFCIPIIDAYYDEYFGKLPPDMADKRFGQFDHVRLFGKKDMGRHIGSILKLDYNYSLTDYATADVLEKFNIPEFDRTGLTGSTIFVCKKRITSCGYSCRRRARTNRCHVVNM